MAGFALQSECLEKRAQALRVAVVHNPSALAAVAWAAQRLDVARVVRTTLAHGNNMIHGEHTRSAATHTYATEPLTHSRPRGGGQLGTSGNHDQPPPMRFQAVGDRALPPVLAPVGVAVLAVVAAPLTRTNQMALAILQILATLPSANLFGVGGSPCLSFFADVLPMLG